MREQSYGRWLSCCRGVGVIDPRLDMTERVSESAMRGFLSAESARCSALTVFMHAVNLLVVFSALAPDKDWIWLKRIVGRLRANCSEGELKPRQGLGAHEIFAWARTRMRDIDGVAGITERVRAIRFRDALMFGLLIATALRMRTFIAIDVEKHLVRTADGFVLRFGPEDMKDRKARNLFLPRALNKPMQRYLSAFRPTLLGAKSSSRLWITHLGHPFTYGAFEVQLPALTLKAFGIALRPHAFRSIAATSIATDAPEHVNIIADVLGHSTLAMSEKHYNRANGVRAASDWQQVVKEWRQGRRREREASRRATLSTASRRSANVEV